MKQDILTARAVAEIQRQKKWGWHHDGGGLYLVGSETYGTFSWTLRIYRNTVTGRPRDLGLGSAKIFWSQASASEGTRDPTTRPRGCRSNRGEETQAR